VSDCMEAEYSGCPTCSSMRYLTIVGGKIVSSDCVRDLLVARHRAGLPVDIDYAAISHLLHDGFVPQPLTVYRDVFSIGIGFTARLEQGAITFHRRFPFRLKYSRGDQDSNPQNLLEHLARATAAACSARPDSVLLLSAGLDSTSLAVAAKHAGHDELRCVTYGEHDQRNEVDLARAVCRQLGLRHEAHIVDIGSKQMPQMLLQYAGVVPEPCGDPAQIASVSAIAASCNGNSVVLDGSGSDFYFWSPPRPLDLLKVQLVPGRFAGVRKMRSLLPFHVSYERLLSSPIEPYLLHGAWLRHCDTRIFFPQSIDTHRFWLSEFLANGEIPDEEARFQTRAMYVGPGAHMKKTRNAALSVGALAQFPWSDAKVAQYCFHLPENRRYDRAGRKSKILVREMLRQLICYDADRVGKRSFLFGKRNFLEAHMQFCREQIAACTLWSPAIGKTVDQLARSLGQGRPTENALLSLLMVSLWHNHWFVGGLPAALGKAQLRQAG
jgi:asparagine synthetase B (glutamine-hydrolysing)